MAERRTGAKKQRTYSNKSSPVRPEQAQNERMLDWGDDAAGNTILPNIHENIQNRRDDVAVWQNYNTDIGIGQ